MRENKEMMSQKSNDLRLQMLTRQKDETLMDNENSQSERVYRTTASTSEKGVSQGYMRGNDNHTQVISEVYLLQQEEITHTKKGKHLNFSSYIL